MFQLSGKAVCMRTSLVVSITGCCKTIVLCNIIV